MFENIDSVTIVIAIAAYLIHLLLLGWAISESVKGHFRKQNDILLQQNDMLIMLLNQQGIGKDQLMDIFVSQKKDIWSSIRD